MVEGYEGGEEDGHFAVEKRKEKEIDVGELWVRFTIGWSCCAWFREVLLCCFFFLFVAVVKKSGGGGRRGKLGIDSGVWVPSVAATRVCDMDRAAASGRRCLVGGVSASSIRTGSI